MAVGVGEKGLEDLPKRNVLSLADQYLGFKELDFRKEIPPCAASVYAGAVAGGAQ